MLTLKRIKLFSSDNSSSKRSKVDNALITAGLGTGTVGGGILLATRKKTKKVIKQLKILLGKSKMLRIDYILWKERKDI